MLADDRGFRLTDDVECRLEVTFEERVKIADHDGIAVFLDNREAHSSYLRSWINDCVFDWNGVGVVCRNSDLTMKYCAFTYGSDEAPKPAEPKDIVVLNDGNVCVFNTLFDRPPTLQDGTTPTATGILVGREPPGLLLLGTEPSLGMTVKNCSFKGRVLTPAQSPPPQMARMGAIISASYPSVVIEALSNYWGDPGGPHVSAWNGLPGNSNVCGGYVSRQVKVCEGLPPSPWPPEPSVGPREQ